MKKVFVVLLSLVLVFTAVNILMAQEKAKTSKQAMAMPAADGEQLSRYIMKGNHYTKWKLFPGTKKLYNGTEPHGILLTTYVNNVAMDSIRKKTAFAEGSIIVKENYMPDKKLAALTVMYKVKGFNPEAGDWFWLKAMPDGMIEGSGRMSMCIQCHTEAKGTDFMFTKMPK